MKKIVLVNQHTAYLFIDIVNAFAEKYDEVVLIAGVIHPLGNELNEKVRVQKIVPYDINSTFSRLRSWVTGFIQVWWLLVTKHKDHEVFLYSNPPLLTFLPLVVRRKMSHLIVDVYPDALITTDTVKSERSLIFRVWSLLNKISLSKFYSISTITDAMADRILRYVKGFPVPVINLWADGSFKTLEVKRSENLFFQEYNLDPRKTYIIYSGNLGKGHDVDLLVDLANMTRHNPDIFYIIAGNGFKKQLIIDKIASMVLENCIWLPYQEREIFNHMMAAIDIGVVTIDEPNAYVSIPSKTFNLLAAGKPIICFGKKDSELGQLVHNSKAGKIFAGNDLEECKSFLNELTKDQDQYNLYAENARNASGLYTSENAKEFVNLHISSTVPIKSRL